MKKRNRRDEKNQNNASTMSSSAFEHPRERRSAAHAHWIVLTENAVGFENGGQCVPSDRETYTLYVSKAAAHGPPILSRRKTLFSRAPTRRCMSRIPKLLCVWKTWSFSWLCDWRTGEQRLHTDHNNAKAANEDALKWLSWAASR